MISTTICKFVVTDIKLSATVVENMVYYYGITSDRGKEKMKIRIDEYAMCPSRFIVGTKGSRGVAFFDFAFGKKWKSLEKRLVFRTPSGRTVSVACDSDPVRVPDEVLSEKGKTLFSIIGDSKQTTRVSVSGELYVLGSTEEPEHE